MSLPGQPVLIRGTLDSSLALEMQPASAGFPHVSLMGTFPPWGPSLALRCYQLQLCGPLGGSGLEGGT